MRRIYISVHRTEVGGRIALQFATFERGGLPLLETLKIAKQFFRHNVRKIAVSKTKTSKVGPFWIHIHILRLLMHSDHLVTYFFPR